MPVKESDCHMTKCPDKSGRTGWENISLSAMTNIFPSDLLDPVNKIPLPVFQSAAKISRLG